MYVYVCKYAQIYIAKESERDGDRGSEREREILGNHTLVKRDFFF